MHVYYYECIRYKENLVTALQKQTPDDKIVKWFLLASSVLYVSYMLHIYSM